MFWCCSSLSCCWGFMETLTWHSFPLRVFPERAPGITRKIRSGLGESTSEIWSSLIFVCLMSTCQYTVRFFTSSGTQGSGKLLGALGYSDFGHKGLWEWPWSWAKLKVENRALCCCPRQSVPMESTAGIMQPLSEAHSLTQNLRGLDVLTQTFPQPIYIPVQGQVSIPDLINGADRSGLLSEWGKLNSIKLL